MAITAAMVKELRELTGAGMMDCKKASMSGMFSYTVSKTANNHSFMEACGLIEAALDSFEKERLLMDVDGSMIQIYYTPGGKIEVINDCEVDSVCVDSEVDLSELFGG